MPKYHRFRILVRVFPNIFPHSPFTSYCLLLTVRMIALPNTLTTCDIYQYNHVESKPHHCLSNNSREVRK